MALKRVARLLATMLLGLCTLTHAQMGSPGSAYNTDVLSVQFVDNTANCLTPDHFYSYPSCLAPLTGPISGAALVDVSSGFDNTVRATDAAGNVYYISSADTDVRFKLTSLPPVHKVIVRDATHIYALKTDASCPAGTYGIFQANSTMTGWTRIHSGYCPTFFTVASDGSMGQVRSDLHTARFLRAGTSTWVVIPGSYSSEIAIVDSTLGYVNTPTGSYQVDLTNPSVQTFNAQIGGTHISVTPDNIVWSTGAQGNVGYWDFGGDNQPNPIRGSLSTVSAGSYVLGVYNGTAYHYINYALEVKASTHGQYTGTCVPPPGGSPCSHTATTTVSFETGGDNGSAGVTANFVGTFNGALNATATERSHGCDATFAPKGKSCIPRIVGQVICSIGGLLFRGNPPFDFEVREAITNSKYVAGSQNTMGPSTYCAVNDNCLPGSGPMGSPPFASYDHVFVRPLTVNGPKRSCAPGYLIKSICARMVNFGQPQPWGCSQLPLSFNGSFTKDTAFATDASAKSCTGPRSYYDRYPAP
jgi:hypothetical protein